MKFFSLSQGLDDIHTIDNLAHAHIAQCSAENIMLWCQFVQQFSLDDRVATVLGREYHLKRVSRPMRNFLSSSDEIRFTQLHRAPSYR